MLDFRLDSGEWRRQAPGSHSDTFRAARGWRTPGARATSGRVARSRMDSPGAPSGSGRGEKRPASDAADASDLFKRGGPKSIRASAAPRVDAGGRPAGDAEGAGDDGSRARRPRADADAEDGDGAPGSAGVCPGGSRARADDADGGSLRSRPRLLAKFRALCGALARRLSAHADNVTVAVWRAELGVAEVLRPRGKHLTRMGYQVGTRAFLFPEETAFLVETERCALLASAESATPLSLRAVRALCVGTVRASKSPKTLNPRPTVSGDAYALYAHLARRGYVVRRFGAPWSADARFWRSFLENRSAETIETTHRVEINARVEARVDLPETGDALLPSDRRVTAEKMHSAHVGPWYLSARRWLDATREDDATLKKKRAKTPDEVLRRRRLKTNPRRKRYSRRKRRSGREERVVRFRRPRSARTRRTGTSRGKTPGRSRASRSSPKRRARPRSAPRRRRRSRCVRAIRLTSARKASWARSRGRASPRASSCCTGSRPCRH